MKGRPPPEHHHKDLIFYYDRLRELSVDKKSGLAARTRFMIKDLLELRDNNWVPRRMEAKATKTEEFRRELGDNKGGGTPKATGGPASGKGTPGGSRHGGPGPTVLQRQGSSSSDKGDGREKRPGRGVRR